MHKLTAALCAAAATLTLAGSAGAATITWNAWNSGFTTSATAGSATGVMGAVNVSYSGELENLFANYPSWTPTSSYTGGNVGNAPNQADGIIQLFGASGATNTISFSHTVIDPVIAIWSLGQSGATASFVFTSPFTIVAGGPSLEYNGGPLGGVSPTVSGNEGNGTIQFKGKFNSLTFTNPQFENWYGFAVGTTGVAGVPEPASWALMILGFGGVGATLRSRRRQTALTA